VAPERLWDVFDPGSFTHLYLLGYDALKDLDVLRVSLDRFPNAIGLIASASKREHLFARLRADGRSRESISRVRSPIGLNIGAESPAEIAVSVVAEIVANLHPAPLGTRAAPERAPQPEDDAVSRTP
jgi:xanthine dehydrogenase accessory factor